MEEPERVQTGAAKRMAGSRRFDSNPTLDFYKLLLAGTKAAKSLGWLKEAISRRNQHTDGGQRPSSACDPMRTSRSVCPSGFS